MAAKRESIDSVVTHKHVELKNVFHQTHPDDTGALRQVEVLQHCTMDVPADELDAFLAEARTKWLEIEVTDECPEHCNAQLAPPVGA